MNKKVLITGGAGFIGSHLVKTYLDGRYEVVVVDKKVKSNHSKSALVQYYQQDITQPGLDEIFKREKPDIINHHAALIHVQDSFQNPVEYTQTNVLATINLLELAKQYKIQQFIFASSAAVYGNSETQPLTETMPTKPDSFYGLDKLLSEYYIRLYSKYFTTTIFRYANVYGPLQTSSAEGGVVAIFCQALSRGIVPEIYGNGNQTRDFIYVKDVALANLLSSQKNVEGLMQVSTNRQTSINTLLNLLISFSGKKLDPIYKPKRNGDILHSFLDNAVIKRQLGWEPRYNLENGLQETWDYFAS